MKIRIKVAQLGLGALLGLSCLLGWTGSASALSGSDFQPGRIIDDQVFYNPNDMTVAQIQSFLNALVPTCDTGGNQPYFGTYGGVTHHGEILRKNLDSHFPPPYVCMKDYLENTTTHANNLGGVVPASPTSAAQIVWDAAQAYGINPKVLITLVEKESLGPLTTDDWPWPTEYKTATGYGCPDSSVCDSQYFGFYNQVHNAARQFRLYTNTPNSYNYTIGANNIKYHPDPSSCGTQLVTIGNQATANLYNYTPYVPNQAALNNLYGLGDACSAYGNRNFWRIFNDWFGSTFGGDPVSDNMKLVGPITMSPASPVPGQAVTATYTVKNVGSTAVNFQASVLQCRFFKTTTCDPAWGGAITFNPGDQHTFNTSIGAVRSGSYTLTPYFETGGTWYRYLSDTGGGNSLSFQATAYVAPMSLVGGITSSPAAPVPGQTATLSYTVKNNGSQPAIFQNSVLQCRFNGTNCDPPWNAPVTIAAGGTQTFTNAFVMRAGQYWFAPYYEQNDTWYSYAGDAVALTGNALPIKVPAYVANMGLVGPIYSSPAAPIPGQTATVTYTVRNRGDKPAIFENSLLQCRLNTYTVCDPAWNAPITINPGAQQTLSSTFVVGAGSYWFTPYYEQNGSWYRYANDTVAMTGNALPLTVARYVANLSLVGPIYSSPAQPAPGQTAMITYTVRNNGSQPAILQNSVLQCRLNTYTNCDPAWNAPTTINAGAQQTFTSTFSSIRAGSYWFTPYFEQNDSWYLYGRDTVALTGNALPLTVR